MAGPGGGPPRKSHTKSRKGCKTCKRRHIRCDENFPQCRNCTKHNTRCDYMDSPPPGDDPNREAGPNLLWNPTVETEVDSWLRTGIYPFPELGLIHHHQFQNLSRIELRLVHHLSTIYRDLSRKGLVQCTSWVEKLPIFLDTAAGFDFVMSAILAFSATHLADITNSTETRNLAYHHRGVALNGLHTAIGNFSDENSDPILAASLLLSWQASDFSGWISLIQGLSSVISTMDAWKDNSQLAYYVESCILTKTPTFAPPSMGGLMAPMLPEDDRSLQQSISALQSVLLYLPDESPLRRFTGDILRSAQDIEVSSRSAREDQLFQKLEFLRMRLLWAPVTMVQQIDSTHMNLCTIVHLYSTAMAIDASLPELRGAALGGITGSAIEEIDRRIRFTSPHGYDSASVLDELMQFPRQMATKNSLHRSAIMGGSVGRPDSIHGSAHGSIHGSIHGGRSSPYGFQNLNLDSAPHTPNFPPSFPAYGQNISQEDLSVPPSPFLSSFVPHPGSRRHSGLLEGHSPRPTSMNFDQRSFSQLGYRDDSPSYSPAGYSPAHSFLEDNPELFAGTSPGWHPTTTNFNYDDSLEKNKGRTNT